MLTELYHINSNKHVLPAPCVSLSPPAHTEEWNISIKSSLGTSWPILGISTVTRTAEAKLFSLKGVVLS